MRQAFSLVELSIVLVILGLLTGGILAGQSLIRASELRSVSAEHSRFTAAVAAFRDKYFALPGDLPNAVKLWGQQAGGTADGYDSTCAATNTGGVAATGTLTCNGDGNGRIGSTLASYYEWHRAWQHLANAGMVEGTYSGISGGTTNNYTIVPGTNAPRSKLNNAGWTIRGLGPMVDDTNWFGADYGNMLQFGAAVTNDWTNGPVLKAEEAWNIDTKADDGLPQSGRVLTYKNALRPNCINVANTAYDLANTSIGCNLMFVRIL